MKLLSHVRFFVTPWTVAHQAPLSMEFSRQEFWSGLAFPVSYSSNEVSGWFTEYCQMAPPTNHVEGKAWTEGWHGASCFVFPIEETYTRAPTRMPAASKACEHPCVCQIHLPSEHPSNVSSSETPGSKALLLCLAKSFDAGIFIT